MTDNQTSQIPQDIRTFLENLLEDSGLVLTAEMKESMIEELYPRLEQKLIADAIEHMKPEDADEFAVLIQSNKSQEELQQFILTRLPNAQDIFASSLVDFRNYFLEGTTHGNSTDQASDAGNSNQPGQS